MQKPIGLENMKNPMHNHNLTTQYSDILQTSRSYAENQYRKNYSPHAFFKAWDDALQSLLSQLWMHLNLPQNIALLAIGGFGRAEIYPYSDIDIALVGENSLNSAQQEQCAQFIQLLWDIGLTPSVQIGSINELLQLAEENLEFDTALLESRLITGTKSIAQQLLQTRHEKRNLANFIDGKLQEQYNRHTKNTNATSLLEPNIKTCTGGLRDLHTMMWLAKVQGLPAHFQRLMRKNILTKTEAGLLLYSHKQLAKIRIELHLASHRNENRLLFDLQNQVALSLNLEDDNQQIRSEKLMKTFYRASKNVKQLNHILLPMLKERVYSNWPKFTQNIDDNFYQVRNTIAVKNLNLFKEQPEQIFRIIEVMQHHNDINHLAPKTLRAWWLAGQQINHSFYQNPINRQRFIEFFKRGNGLTHTLRRLNLYGLLGKYLPNWGRIVGHMQHDLFHVYPVDEHILMVVRNMRRFAIDAHSHEFPVASNLIQQFNKPFILYLAAFFHDIAKGRQGNHSQEGIQDAKSFAKDHFLSHEETHLLCFLVENHLLLSQTAQKEDIRDPLVIQSFCQTIQTPERLIALYLLTIADIRGTNPKIWNSWKANLIDDLFHSSMLFLQGKTDSPMSLISQRHDIAMLSMQKMGLSEAQQRKTIQDLGQAYFSRYEKRDIVWHLKTIATEMQEPTIATRFMPHSQFLQVMVFMPNNEHLFAKMCHIFSSYQLDILAAKAFVTDHHFVLDTFTLHIPDYLLYDQGEKLLKKLEKTLRHFAMHPEQFNIASIAKPKSRRLKHLPLSTHIELIQEEIEPLFTLNIITYNRLGLLANIAKILSEFNIHLHHAKITTMDERVEDSFLISSPTLLNTHTQLALKEALTQTLYA